MALAVTIGSAAVVLGAVYKFGRPILNTTVAGLHALKPQHYTPGVIGFIANKFTRTKYDLDKIRRVFNKNDLQLDSILVIRIEKTHEFKFKVVIKPEIGGIITERFSPTLTTQNTENERLVRQFIEGTQYRYSINLRSNQWRENKILFKITVGKFITIANTPIKLTPDIETAHEQNIIRHKSFIGDIKAISSKRPAPISEHVNTSNKRRRV